MYDYKKLASIMSAKGIKVVTGGMPASTYGVVMLPDKRSYDIVYHDIIDGMVDQTIARTLYSYNYSDDLNPKISDGAYSNIAKHTLADRMEDTRVAKEIRKVYRGTVKNIRRYNNSTNTKILDTIKKKRPQTPQEVHEIQMMYLMVAIPAYLYADHSSRAFELPKDLRKLICSHRWDTQADLWIMYKAIMEWYKVSNKQVTESMGEDRELRAVAVRLAKIDADIMLPESTGKKQEVTDKLTTKKLGEFRNFETMDGDGRMAMIGDNSSGTFDETLEQMMVSMKVKGAIPVSYTVTDQPDEIRVIGRADDRFAVRANPEQSAIVRQTNRMREFFRNRGMVGKRGKARGRVIASKLVRTIAPTAPDDIFTEHRTDVLKNTAVSLMVDQSGSMDTCASQTIYNIKLLARVLDNLGVRYDITGFTTASVNSSGHLRELDVAGIRGDNSMYNEERPKYTIYKRMGAEVSMRALDQYKPTGGTPICGPLLYARNNLARVSAKHKYAFLWTDGGPSFETYVQIARTIEDIERSGTHVVMIVLDDWQGYTSNQWQTVGIKNLVVSKDLTMDVVMDQLRRIRI